MELQDVDGVLGVVEVALARKIQVQIWAIFGLLYK